MLARVGFAFVPASGNGHLLVSMMTQIDHHTLGGWAGQSRWTSYVSATNSTKLRIAATRVARVSSVDSTGSSHVSTCIARLLQSTCQQAATSAFQPPRNRTCSP